MTQGSSGAMRRLVGATDPFSRHSNSLGLSIDPPEMRASTGVGINNKEASNPPLDEHYLLSWSTGPAPT